MLLILNFCNVAGQDYVALSDFRVRWLADQVDPRYITRPNVIRDPVFQFTIIDDSVAENLIEYFEIDLKLNRQNGNGFFYPNAVGRVTIIDDDIRKLLMHADACRRKKLILLGF